MNVRILKDKNFICEHMKRNIFKYMLSMIILIVGIIVGTLYFNNISDKSEVSNQINRLLSSDIPITFKETYSEFLYKNIITVIILWLIGSSVIGLPVVAIFLCYNGFTLAFTISSIINLFGYNNSTFEILFYIFVQNLFFLPLVIAILISSLKLTQNVLLKQKNIKIEIIRHTFIFVLLEIAVFVISLLQAYMNTNALSVISKIVS